MVESIRSGIKLNRTECWGGQWKIRLKTLMNGTFAIETHQWTAKTWVC